MRSEPASLRRTTTIDRLPVEPDSPLGHHGPMTVAERALLNALMPRLAQLLDGEGVTVAYVVERSGCGSMQCTQFLEELGAKRCAYKSRWRRPRLAASPRW